MSDKISIIELLEGVEVEWKKLDDIVEFRRGSFPQPYGNSKWYDGEGSMPFVQVADVSDNGFYLNGDTKQKISKLAQPKSIFVEAGTVIVTLQGTIGRVAITQYDCYVDRTLAIFTNYKENINKKYFAYQLKSKFDLEKKYARGSTLKTITKEEFSKFEIPIPPLHIQSEIVRILDNFTELTTELTTELRARKKQYSYYRDKLLTFEDEEVEFKPLGEMLHLKAGQHISASKIMQEQSAEYRYPCFGGNGIRGYVTKNSHDGEHLFIGRQGALCGNVQRMKGQFYATEHAVVVTVKENIDIDWAFHLLTIMNLNQYASQSAQPGLAVGNINALKIPVPSLEEQKYVAFILDKFDTLTNTISDGLPKEIELRTKQYEYYRDLLLTFPKQD